MKLIFHTILIEKWVDGSLIKSVLAMKPVKMVAMETIWNTLFQIFFTSTSLQTNALGNVRDAIFKKIYASMSTSWLDHFPTLAKCYQRKKRKTLWNLARLCYSVISSMKEEGEISSVYVNLIYIDDFEMYVTILVKLTCVCIVEPFIMIPASSYSNFIAKISLWLPWKHCIYWIFSYFSGVCCRIQTLYLNIPKFEVNN